MASGILITAISSGSGKTAAACALMAAYQAQNKKVSSCKCGPDYIDPMFHKEVLGVDSKNLDLFFSSEDELRKEYAKHAADAELVITEGVMGYYDGMRLDSVTASSYDVARTLDIPAVLILPLCCCQRDCILSKRQQYSGDHFKPGVKNVVSQVEENAGRSFEIRRV